MSQYESETRKLNNHLQSGGGRTYASVNPATLYWIITTATEENDYADTGYHCGRSGILPDSPLLPSGVARLGARTAQGESWDIASFVAFYNGTPVYHPNGNLDIIKSILSTPYDGIIIKFAGARTMQVPGSGTMTFVQDLLNVCLCGSYCIDIGCDPETGLPYHLIDLRDYKGYKGNLVTLDMSSVIHFGAPATYLDGEITAVQGETVSPRPIRSYYVYDPYYDANCGHGGAGLISKDLSRYILPVHIDGLINAQIHTGYGMKDFYKEQLPASTIFGWTDTDLTIGSVVTMGGWIDDRGNSVADSYTIRKNITTKWRTLQ